MKWNATLFAFIYLSAVGTSHLFDHSFEKHYLLLAFFTGDHPVKTLALAFLPAFLTKIRAFGRAYCLMMTAAAACYFPNLF